MNICLLIAFSSALFFLSQYIGKIGTVHRVTDKGDIRVQYEGCSNRWTFHPDALTKVCHHFAAVCHRFVTQPAIGRI